MSKIPKITLSLIPEFLKEFYEGKITKTGKWYRLEMYFKKKQRKENYLLDGLKITKAKKQRR